MVAWILPTLPGVAGPWPGGGVVLGGCSTIQALDVDASEHSGSQEWDNVSAEQHQRAKRLWRLEGQLDRGKRFPPKVLYAITFFPTGRNI